MVFEVVLLLYCMPGLKEIGSCVQIGILAERHFNMFVFGAWESSLELLFGQNGNGRSWCQVFQQLMLKAVEHLQSHDM